MLTELVKNMPEDNLEAIEYLIGFYKNMDTEIDNEQNDDLLGFFFIFIRSIENYKFSIKLDFGVPNYSSIVIAKKIKELITQIKPMLISIKTGKLMNIRSSGEIISDETIASIQEQIHSLRKALESSDDISEEHKTRLLSRLEHLQQELHKKIPNIDLLFSYATKICLIVENFGKSSKQLTENGVALMDSARKLTQQVWGLSTDIPILSSLRKDILSIESKKS